MRNLKRALSLALASIMVLGMMVVGAGAVNLDDFSDKDKIVNSEAVTTMVSLGVINGKDDGSYDPEGIVTRAEMAKLISVMLNGGKDPTLGAITAEFTDTKGHWAENYIAYVANLKIVDGRGDGTFGPNDQVTGAQAAKMLLTALGYRSEIEGFTGANWAVNVQLKGNDIKLFADLTINPDEGLSRDNTAQMIYNAVQAQEVEYRNLDGNYNNVIYPTEKGTMLANRFDVVKVEGVVVANDFFAVEDIATAPTGKTRIRTTDVYKDRNGDYQTSTDNYGVVVPNDMVGKRIVIYVKFQNNLAPNAVGSVVIGTPILSDKNNIVVTNGKLKDDTKVKDALKGSGIAITKDKDNNYATEVLVNEKETKITAPGSKNTGVQTVPGVEQTFIDHNDDGIVDYVIQRNPGLAKVTTYNTKDEKLTLTGIGSIDFDDIANADDVAKDDYVLVAKYNDTYYLTKAESASGEVTKFDSSNDKITIDGTAYGVGAGKNVTADLYDQDDYKTMMNEMVEGTYTLYLDPFGNILGYVEDEGAVGNYAVITASDDTSSTNQKFYSGKVKLQMSDGTSGTYDVNLLASAKKWDSTINTGSNSEKEEKMANLLGTDGLVGTIVTYSLDGNTVTMGLPSQANTRYSEDDSATGTLKSSKSYYDFSSVRVMADNNTVFFIQDKNGDFTTIVGLNKLPSTGLTIKGSESSVVYYTGVGSKTNVARAIYAHVTEEFTSNSNYAYVSDKYSKNTNGIYLYPVVFEDGTVGELKSKTNQGQFDGQVVEYQMAADGYATLDTDKYTVNEKFVSEVGKYAVDLVNADNHDAGKISYALLNNHKVWNVEDTDDVFETSIGNRNLICAVLDDDGNLRTAFVYDTDDTDMTAEPTNNLTAVGGTLDLSKGTWTDVAAGNTLTLNLTLGANQTATVKVTEDGTGTTAYATATKVSGNVVVYTAGADEDNANITVTLTVSETDKTSRVITYKVTASADRATASAVAERTLDTNSTDGVLTVSDDATSATLNGVVLAGEKVTLKVAPAAATATIKSINVSGLNEDGIVTASVDADAKTAAKDIYTIQAGDEGKTGTVTVVVEIAETGKLSIEETYTFTIAVPVTYSIDSAGNYIAGKAVELSGKTANGYYRVVETNKVFKADSSGNLTIDSMPAQDINLKAVFTVNTPIDATANGLLVKTSSLSDVRVAENETFTVTVTVKGNAIATSKTIKIAGTGITVKSATVSGTGLDVSGTDAVVIGTSVDATITFTLENTGTADIANLTVTPEA